MNHNRITAEQPEYNIMIINMCGQFSLEYVTGGQYVCVYVSNNVLKCMYVCMYVCMLVASVLCIHVQDCTLSQRLHFYPGSLPIS